VGGDLDFYELLMGELGLCWKSGSIGRLGLLLSGIRLIESMQRDLGGGVR
jgi:hypothetical protein